MLVQLRRGSALVVLALAAALVAWAPGQASPAQALVTPPPPVTLPGSVLGGMAGTASTDAVVGGLTASGGTAVVGGTAAGGALAAEAAGGTAAVGLVVGAVAGTQLAKWAGLPTSGNFLCDVSWAFNSTAMCSTKAGPTWTVNGDVPADPHGWVNGVNTVTYPDGLKMTLTVTGPNEGTAGTYTVGSVNSIPAGYTGAKANGNNSLGYVYVTGANGAAGSPSSNLASLWWNGQYYTPTFYPSGSLTLAAGTTSRGVQAKLSGTVVAQWYPVGDPLRPPDVDPNPARHWAASWSCTDGSQYAAVSANFYETDATWPAMPDASCSGSALAHLLLEEVSGGTSKTMYEYTAPSAVTTWAASADPTCVGGGCQLLLYRVDQSGALLNCFSSSSVCASWWADTQQATTNTDQYRCQLGATVQPLTDCEVYSHAFDQGVYADPRTGQTASTATGADPATSPQDQSCPPPFSFSALFNNWWAYKATACALREAFVPSDGFWTDQEAQLQSSLGTRAPFSVIAVVPAAVTGLSSGWSAPCSSLPNFSTLPDHPLRMACAPPDSPGWRAAYVLMGVLVWVSGVFALWRMAHHAVGGTE